jgi:hypothetical protein
MYSYYSTPFSYFSTPYSYRNGLTDSRYWRRYRSNRPIYMAEYLSTTRPPSITQEEDDCCVPQPRRPVNYENNDRDYYLRNNWTDRMSCVDSPVDYVPDDELPVNHYTRTPRIFYRQDMLPGSYGPVRHVSQVERNMPRGGSTYLCTTT